MIVVACLSSGRMAPDVRTTIIPEVITATVINTMVSLFPYREAITIKINR